MIPPPNSALESRAAGDTQQPGSDFVEMAATASWAGDKKRLLDSDDEDEQYEEGGTGTEPGIHPNAEEQHVQVNGTSNINRAAADPQQQVHGGDDDGGGAGSRPPCSAYVTVIVLFCVNLLNYADRYTVAANLLAIQRYFGIQDDNSSAGLIQTVFILGYMLTSPIFGYLGDRYSRKYVVTVGILFWSATTLAGSFVPGGYFWAFLLLRGLVGVGEASYVTIAATLIGDLFTGNRRSRMLMLFYFAIPVGSGLGYILGKAVAEIAGDWKWALRFTPPLGIVCVILILLLIKEPKRGQAETGEYTMANTSYIADIKALCRNKSYISSTLGLTSVCWVTGALALWAVTAVEDAYMLQGRNSSSVSIIFGVITMAAGFIGVGTGTSAAQLYRRYSPRADPLVCACGMFASAPFLFIALEISDLEIGITWTFVFIAETLVCLNWALVPDILLAVLIPTRRSTGNAIQMLISHLLGDALSPWLVGAVSDSIRNGFEDNTSQQAQYTSLIYALYMTCFVTVLGGGAFLVNALYYEQDKKRVERIVETIKGQKLSNGTEAGPSNGTQEGPSNGTQESPSGV